MLEEHPAEVVMEKINASFLQTLMLLESLILDLNSHSEVCPDFHFLPYLFLQSK